MRADPYLLHYCLLNLLDNAGRYGAPDTPIVITGRNRFGELHLSARDHGLGIPRHAGSMSRKRNGAFLAERTNRSRKG